MGGWRWGGGVGGLSLNDLKFSTFIGRFPSDGPASMAVKLKGLILPPPPPPQAPTPLLPIERKTAIRVLFSLGEPVRQLLFS